MNVHWGIEVISGTTVPTYPNRASAPRMIPAGMAAYYREAICMRLRYQTDVHWHVPTERASSRPLETPMKRDGLWV